MASTFKTITALCLLAIVLQCTGLLLFVLGFFPVKPPLNGRSGSGSFATGCDVQDSEEVDSGISYGNFEEWSEIPSQFDRVVFMVIDGLPAEFILGKDGKPPAMEFMAAMPYTQELLATGGGLGFHAKAASPTVTMPRLKAMTSGAIAGFLDVAYNLNTQALVDDNWVAQAARAGWRMVMLGDNTWLKLFPNHFERHDGVHSFFVKDTVEVDGNVTRHLDVELQSNDWDLLVLHYLGLDHVGHLGGRSSPLMVPKLREMDEVIMRIHQSVLRESSSARKSLLVVVSDHGMTESGNHGGGTSQETDSLALFVPGIGCGLTFPIVADSSSQGCKSRVAYQVDVVPSMSLLVGLPIPKNSVGSLLLPLFSSLNHEQQIRALELNSWQLMRLVHAQYPGSACVEELCQNPQSYKSAESLSNHWNSDKLHEFCTLFQSALSLQHEWKLKIVGTQMPPDEADIPSFEMVKEAYLDFLKSTSEWLARGSTEKRLSFMLIGSAMLLASTLLFIFCLTKTCCCISAESVLPSGQVLRRATPALLKIVGVGGVCVHAASLSSSSFVEEEQFTWYFLVSTLFFGLMRLSFQQMSGTEQALSKSALDVTPKRTYKQVLLLGLLLVVGRALRSWHRSGVNWAHLPDVAKYLDSGNPVMVAIIRVICVCCVTVLCCRMISKSLPKLLSSLIILGLSSSGGIILLYMRFSSTPAHDFEATLVARLCFGVLGATSLTSCVIIPWTIPWSVLCHPPVGKLLANEEPELVSLEGTVDVAMDATGQVLISCWCLLQLLLQQPVNAGPILLLQLQLILTLSFFQKMGPSYHRWMPILALHWLGNSGHFGLGNSNTLATVDVAGAYIGLTSHSTVLSGTLAFIITYGSPLLYLQALLLQKSATRKGVDRGSLFSQLWLLESFALPVVLPLALNSVVLIIFTGVVVTHQHHLFVWSVFSPKYLYVCMTTVSLYVGLFVVVAVESYSSLVVLSRRTHWKNSSLVTIKKD